MMMILLFDIEVTGEEPTAIYFKYYNGVDGLRKI
jgi:hypothetical protein